MNPIQLYSTRDCCWRSRARSLLRAHGPGFEEFDIASRDSHQGPAELGL